MYIFQASSISSSHPFHIRRNRTEELPPEFNQSGSPLSGSNEEIIFMIPHDYHGIITYYCTAHTSMTETFTIN